MILAVAHNPSHRWLLKNHFYAVVVLNTQKIAVIYLGYTHEKNSQKFNVTIKNL